MSDPGDVVPVLNATPAASTSPAGVHAPDARTVQGVSGDDERRKRFFAYDETKRVLDRRAAVLSELRNRANIVLAADVVVATLFASSVLGKGNGHPLTLEIGSRNIRARNCCMRGSPVARA